MKRSEVAFRGVVMLLALTLTSSASAEEPAAQPVVKRTSDAPVPRGEAQSPDPSRVVEKPVPTVQSRVAPEACTPKQEKVIEAARRAGAVRSQVATDRARGLHPNTGERDRLEAEQAANQLIDVDVDFGQVVEITETIRDRMSSASLPVVCESKSNPNCAVRAAYVTNLEPPIHICPAFFDTSSSEQRIRTMIHESAHLAGLREQGDSESYCVFFDCETNCGGFYAADSWAHFVHCVAGETPDTP
jgi:hypothetical protein